VVEVIVPTERGTGRPRGFAFVEYEDGDAMAEAIKKFNGYELDGRELRVNEATERPPRRPSFSPDDFGGGFGGGKPPRGGKPKGSRRNLRGKKRSL
jgi:RNA recognition motif-containing protein